MIKVHILDCCSYCEGQAFLPAGEVENYKGEKHTRYLPCLYCEGTGEEDRWISLAEFASMLEKAKCPHEHTMIRGGFHFSAGNVYDDIQEVCLDCGSVL
jgi:hypothetical protein